MNTSSNASAHVNDLAWTVPGHGSGGSTDQVPFPVGSLYSSPPLWTPAELHSMAVSSSSLGLWVKQPWATALLISTPSSSKINEETEAPPEGNFSP